MAKKVEAIRIESMNNAQSNEFMTANINRAKADAKIVEYLSPQLDAWEAANTQFDSYLKQTQRVLLTEDIKGYDDVQDADLVALKGMVRALQSVPDPTLKESARKVKLCVDTYKIETDWEYVKEMNYIRQMLDDLQGRYAADVAALGLTLFVEKLAQSNAAVRQAQIQRDDDAAGQLKGQTAAWRKETEKKYREFVEMLNARALVFGDADYAAFIDKLNSSIDHYRQILAVAAGIRAAKKKDKENGESSDDNGSNSSSSSSSSSNSGTVEPVPNGEQGGTENGGSEEGGGSEQGGSSENGGTEQGGGGSEQGGGTDQGGDNGGSGGGPNMDEDGD